MSIAKSLKKLAVRLTGAEDLNSVKGSSICDVLDYAGKNLNTDSSGKLLVKEYVEPSQPSTGGNLLSAPVTVTYSSDTSVAYTSPLNLVEGKTYAITYTYKGTTSTVQREALNSVTSSDNFNIEGVVTLGNAGEFGIVIGDNEGMFLIADHSTFATGGPSYSADTCSILMAGMGSALDNLIVESITEV